MSGWLRVRGTEAMAGKSPFKSLAKTFEKIFKGDQGEPSCFLSLPCIWYLFSEDSEDASKIHSVVSNMHLPPEQQKEMERALHEQLRRQREAEAEKRRQELLETTTASTPWVSIAFLGRVIEEPGGC